MLPKKRACLGQVAMPLPRRHRRAGELSGVSFMELWSLVAALVLCLYCCDLLVDLASATPAKDTQPEPRPQSIYRTRPDVEPSCPRCAVRDACEIPPDVEAVAESILSNVRSPSTDTVLEHWWLHCATPRARQELMKQIAARMLEQEKTI